MTIVLASASTSRAQLLRSAGVDFEIEPADIDEEATKLRVLESGANPASIADELAEKKAVAVSAARPRDLVIGGDQVLWFEGKLISKCTTMDQARRLLARLRGRRHELIGGLVLARAGDIAWRHSSRAQLAMRNFSDAFLEQYLSREGTSILGAVGCYRLEGSGAQLFDAIDGSYFAILGLDILPLLEALRANRVIAT